MDPVNDTLLINGCCETAYPVFPYPLTILMTPGGKPASLIRFPSIKAVIGLC